MKGERWREQAELDGKVTFLRIEPAACRSTCPGRPDHRQVDKPAMEKSVRIGIIGTGNVGCACAKAAVTRGSAREIVLVNRTRKTAEAVATDMRYGTPLDHCGRERKNRRRYGSQRPTGPPQTAGQERRNLSRYRAKDRAGGAQRGTSRRGRSTRSARRYRARDVPRGGGVEHRYISRQPAISRSPRQALRRGSRACRSTDDWRPRDLAGVPVVLGKDRRSSSGGIAREARRADWRAAA